MDALNEPRKNHHNFRTRTKESEGGREGGHLVLCAPAKIECERGRGEVERREKEKREGRQDNALLNMNVYEGAISATQITTSRVHDLAPT